jgi:hypothetical protein
MKPDRAFPHLHFSHPLTVCFGWLKAFDFLFGFWQKARALGGCLFYTPESIDRPARRYVDAPRAWMGGN